MDPLDPLDARQVVVAYAQLLERDLDEGRHPARVDSLPFAKQTIKTAIRTSVMQLAVSGELTDELRSYFETAYTCLADYLEGELVDLVIEYRRTADELRASSTHDMAEMKQSVRGAHHDPWHCRAGQNTVIIRVDGTLAPCFPVYSATHDWGVGGEPHFDQRQLATMKVECEPNCFSTLNHIVSWCYDDGRIIRWMLKQARHGFQSIHGNLE